MPGSGTGMLRDFPGPAGRPGQHDPARRGFLEDRHGIETLYHRGTENRINHSLFVGIHRTGLRVLERCRRKSIADKNEIAPETVNIEFGHCRMRGSVRHSHKAKSDPGGIAFAFIVFVVPIIVLKQCYETHRPDLVIFCSGTFLMRTSQYQGYPEKYPAILRNIRRHPDQEMRTKQVTPTAGSALHVRRTGSRSAEFRSSYRRRAAAPVTPGPQKRESARSAQDC